MLQAASGNNAAGSMWQNHPMGGLGVKHPDSNLQVRACGPYGAACAVHTLRCRTPYGDPTGAQLLQPPAGSAVCAEERVSTTLLSCGSHRGRCTKKPASRSEGASLGMRRSGCCDAGSHQQARSPRAMRVVQHALVLWAGCARAMG